MSEHLQPEEIALLAILDDDHPSRHAAIDHALRCPDCAHALAEATASLDALEEHEPVRPRPEEIDAWRRGTLGAIRRERLVPALAVCAACAIVVPFLAVRATDWGAVLLALGVLAPCLVAAAVALVRASRAAGLVGCVLAVAASLAMATLDSAGGLQVPGLKCLASELAAATLPIAAMIALGVAGRLPPSPLGAAAAAAAGALGAQLALRVLCSDHHAEHLLAFHVGGVLAAALLGLLAGLLARPRRRGIAARA